MGLLVGRFCAGGQGWFAQLFGVYMWSSGLGNITRGINGRLGGRWELLGSGPVGNLGEKTREHVVV